ncbi:MAG: AarF/ABC1/UbiB kinase family protein, partial [Planctomycetota bacterium]
KIQRPHLREILKRDLDLLRQLAALFERDPELRRWQPLALVEEFEKSIYKEIDFGRELHNIKKFAGIFADDPSVYVPSVYEDLSTERVLTMEFIDGIKVSSDRLREQPWFDPEVVAHNGVRMILVQLFEHGFFHADPHPGNLFILPGNVICPIDYGMMGLLDQERIDELLLFLVALLTQNAERMVRLLERQGIVGEHVDTGALKTDLLDLMDRWLGVDLARIDVAVYIQAIFDVITRHRIMLPPDLLLMGKALATIDGVARDIYPQLDPIEAMRPHVLRIYFRRLAAPEFYLRDTRRALEDSIYLAQRLPRIVHQVLLQLRDGRLLVRNEPSEPTLERILRERNRAANRQAVALLIVGGGAISSYLLIHGQGWLPWLGGLGYVAAAVLGLYFVFGLLRSGGQ